MSRSSTIFLAVALVLAACSPGTSDDGDDGTTTTTEAAVVETTEPAPAATSTTAPAPAETTTTEAVQASGGSSCVEGEWLLGPDTFISAMEQAVAEAPEVGDAEISPSEGTYVVTMASDGTFMGVRDDWGFSITTADGTFNIRVNGTESGTWSADDTTITVRVAASDVSVDASAEFDGQSIDLPESPIDVPEAIAESSDYTCSDDELTITTDGITITLDRA